MSKGRGVGEWGLFFLLKPPVSMKQRKPKTDQQLKEMWRKKCCTLAKKIARMRDDYKCQYCGLGEPNRHTQGSHIYSEGTNPSMSADTDNILALCIAHHMAGKFVKSTNFSWHGSPLEAIEWFKEKYPKRYLRLRERSRKTVVCTLKYWQDKYEELKNEIKQYE